MSNLKLSTLLFFLFAVTSVVAQTRQITGTVKDETGAAIPGATISVKGTSMAVLADSAGFFSVSANSKDLLTVSAVGYSTEDFETGVSGTINIVLKKNTQGLDEVVVVGYGTRKRTNVAGAVDQIAGKKISDRPVANVLQGLQGLSAGLNISYAGGAPGATPNINIRGMGSINGGGGSPLILIDGIASQIDDMLRLNPTDIESITTLRDGGTAAIYGARAAFGVLMIETKKGKLGGRQTISYNNYFALSKRTVMPDPITDPYIYKKLRRVALENSPWNDNSYGTFFPWEQEWAKQRSEDPSIEDVRPNPDDPAQWAYMGSNNFNDYFFSKSNFSHYHNLAFSGSSSGKMPINYLLSADYTKENGLIKLTKNDWTRSGFRGNLGINPLSWLKIEDNITIYQLKKDLPTYNVTDVYYTQPVNVPKNPDGTWGNNSAGILAGGLVDGGRNLETRFGFNNILRGVLSFFDKDLVITGSMSNKRELWKGNYSSLPFQVGYGPNDVRLVNVPGYITAVNGTVVQDIYDLFANYNKKIGEHNFALTAGYNQEYYQWDPTSASRNQLISRDLPYISLTVDNTSASISQSGFGSSYYDYAIRSYFGRLNYSFKDRYILDFIARRDGSSRFPPNNRWAFTPGVSGAWVINKENFWNSMNDVVSNFKLRASYAKQGNQSVSYYGYLQNLPIGTSGYLIGGNRLPVTAAPNLSVDPNNYTWESVTSNNFGTDLGFLKNHLNITFDYYVRKTTGMLGPAKVLPAVLGSNAPQQNAADMSTNGWELTVGYNNSFNIANKPFTYSLKGQLWDSKSKITKYDNPLGLFSAAWRQGQTVGEIWGLESDGFFKDEADIATLDQSAIIPWGALEIVPGWPKYIDQDGDKKIIQGLSDKDPKDLKIIGNSQARYRYSFNVDLSWNNIDLSVFLQGVGKMDYYPQHYLFWGLYQQPYANMYPWLLDFYRPEAASAEERAGYPKAYIDAGLADANLNSYYPVLQSWLADNNYHEGGKDYGLDMAQTKYLLNAAYLRVKNITVGYTLPQQFTKKIGIDRLRLFFTGDNITEFSKIKKYLDPESIVDGYGWAYPYQRKYSLGLNVTF